MEEQLFERWDARQTNILKRNGGLHDYVIAQPVGYHYRDLPVLLGALLQSLLPGFGLRPLLEGGKVGFELTHP
jgi:hypothetical protein